MNSSLKSKYPLILASGSPRRKELLEATGLIFKVVLSQVAEDPLDSEDAERMVLRLSEAKTRAVSKDNPDSVVIGADTVVVIDGLILGKPKDKNDAITMLGKLQGRVHHVWSGFCIVHERDQIYSLESDLTKVTMSSFTEKEILQYVETGEPLDKAGAYAAQGIGAQFIEKIEGSYTNVVGLNVAHVMKKLKVLQLI